MINKKNTLLITLTRFVESSQSTIGEFRSSDQLIQGYILEPPGPSTVKEKSARRIPTGIYDIIPHNGSKFKNTYCLFNKKVPQSRAILFHVGNFPKDTQACLLPGESYKNDYVGSSKNALTNLLKYINEKRQTHTIRVRIKNAKGGLKNFNDLK